MPPGIDTAFVAMVGSDPGQALEKHVTPFLAALDDGGLGHRRSAFGHSWGCTGKSFPKIRNRNLGIEGSCLSHDV